MALSFFGMCLRRWIKPLAAYGFFISVMPVFAQADTGYDALDNAAISVKAPGRTPLISIARVGKQLIAVGVHGVIVRSQDDGKSWTQATVPVDLTLTGIYFATPEQGWAVGHYGVILHTSDGGATWKRSLDGLDVINAVIAIAKESAASTPHSTNAILEQRVATAYHAVGPNKPFLTIDACGNGILAAGQQDIAMFSADEGRSWHEWTSQISNPAFNNIYKILNSNGTTFLIGENGMVLRSGGNCVDFKMLKGPFTATLFGGVTGAPNTILVYGLDGSIFKSTDNGTTWNSVSVQTDSNITAGIKLATGKVLVSTLDGNLYLSNDADEDFKKLSVSLPFQISDLALDANGNIVIIGNGGAVVLSVRSLR